MGAEGQVVPQQWFARMTAPDVPSDDRRHLDLVVYGATAHGGALCCDASLMSTLTRTGHPPPCTDEVDGAVLIPSAAKGPRIPRLHGVHKIVGPRLEDRRTVE